MHCLEICIPQAFLLPKQQLQRALEIVAEIGYYPKTGRPPIDARNVMQALYYLVKTGMQWRALPACFGAASTIHAAFQRLIDLAFFENFMLEGLDEYHQKIGLDLKKKVVDCAHTKSPLGKVSVGPSPVDRRKQGTKRSMATEGAGIMLGCVIAPGNRNDAKLLNATLQDIPAHFRSNGDHQIWLDAAYDTKEVRDVCFDHGLRPQISPNKRRKKIEPVRPIQKGGYAGLSKGLILG